MGDAAERPIAAGAGLADADLDWMALLEALVVLERAAP